jgi:hypothetical protein
MQTFLPYDDFLRSAESLDSPRLGKQRVETLQILRALELPEYGWSNHPAVRMWRGFTPALVLYGLVCARVWTQRGHADTTESQIAEFAPEMIHAAQDDLRNRGMLPPWLGEEALHLSHRSKLLTKDPMYYRPLFVDAPTGLDYFWPPPAVETPPRAEVAGRPLWVVRTESAQITGTFLTEGMVALGADSGIEVDVSGRELPDLQALVTGRRRTSKPLLALARFVSDMQAGDDIGIFISRDRALLTGRITGPYAFEPKAVHGLVHRRPVDWQSVIDRSTVQPPASLQDVRPVFQVRRALPDRADAFPNE